MAEGYIYILFNRAFHNDQYKIGMTTKTPAQRAQEISNVTGVPRPFEVLYEQRVSNCREAERLLHERLRRYRSASNREFFDLPLKDAIKALEAVADRVGRLDDAEQGARDPGEIEVEPPHAEEISVAARLKGKSSPKPAGSNATFETHLAYLDAPRQPILIELRKRVLDFDDRLRQGEKCTTYQRIAYSIPGRRIFLEVNVQRAAIVLNLADGGCLDPNDIADDIPKSHGWGQLKKRIVIEKIADLDEVMPFIEAAYRAER